MEVQDKSNINEKSIKKIDSKLSAQYQHDDYNTNESQDSQSNSEADSNDMEDLNIGQ